MTQRLAAGLKFLLLEGIDWDTCTMALPPLEITEKWIRNRVGLNHENLEDVKALTLPGTYHEKITHLGTSLQGFTRLKTLDLSRNGLQSLSGLSHLKVLEKLNLYYNDIKTLDELHLLKYNTNLQDLDLRLNPVTKNEVDYRLFVIHMLPNLRKLDDRSVRDSERKAAILHFDSDQATELMSHPGASDMMRKEATGTNHTSSRSEQISKLGRYPTALDDDDSDLLDLLAKNGDQIHVNNPLSGSEVKSSSFQSHSKEEIRRMENRPVRPTKLDVKPVESRRYQTDSESASSVGDSDQAKPFQDSNTGNPQSSHHAMHQNYPNARMKGQVHFQGEENGVLEDGGRTFEDEIDAYTSYTSKGHFTPNPKAGDGSSNRVQEVFHTPTEEAVFKEPPQVRRFFEPPEEGYDISRSPVVKDESDELLLSLLHLVDRYWNGTKSLHYHSKFQAQARHIIKNAFLKNRAAHPSPSSHTEEKLRRLENENLLLREEVESKEAGGERLHGDLESGLKNAQEEVRQLQTKLQKSMQKNSLLQKELMKSREPNGIILSDASLAEEGLRVELNSLQSENEKLRFQINHFKQLQELASMLQESHKSLVMTNDHLLKEMEELKKRHLQEVKQLHWSYGELKSTMNLLPQSDCNQNPI
ncbi:Centrosomal protein of 72 kDa [Holothuria leucospilota]|uniref:Centrosomal protein of 72 kDa n=1 Tax=Holothuria leucospilota TaxID=206669 RepID=A0A9Q1HCV4_HOLLE|nr:Centrosomal protein of 72 kDa [Holothuria leucospilota]